jgi:hypothetical protein
MRKKSSSLFTYNGLHRLLLLTKDALEIEIRLSLCTDSQQPSALLDREREATNFPSWHVYSILGNTIFIMFTVELSRIF